MRLKIRSISLALLGIAFSLGLLHHKAAAQVVSGLGWSEPLNLSESFTSSSSPVIVADDFGFVHVFWSEDLDGVPHDGAIAPGAGNSILYRRLADGLWTDAIDLAYGGATKILHSPSAAASDDGYLHLVWIENYTLQYSYAPVWNAQRVKAWSPPVELVQGQIGRVRLLNLGDRLLCIYTILFGRDAGLYAISFNQASSDNPLAVWFGPTGFAPQDIGAALDGKGRVHVVWSIVQPPSPAALEVQYAYSEDGGSTWTNSRVVATQTSAIDGLQFAVPWVAARGDDEIHLQWAQGEQAYRWHQYSTNGGKNWSDPYQIWPDLISQTNSQATATDADNNLYWSDVLRYPNGMYLIRWGGNAWQAPEFYFDIEHAILGSPESRINSHALRMAISRGIELHVVFQDQDKAEIWYMSRTLTSSEIATQPVPTQTPLPRVTPATGLLPATEMPLVTPLEASISGPSTEVDNLMSSPGIITLLGVIPVALLVSILVFTSVKKK